MSFRRVLRALDYAYLFFALVILSSLLWAGAGLLLAYGPVMVLFSILNTPADSAIVTAVWFYVAAIFGSIGLFWGLKRWRKHISDEAQNRRAAPKK